MNRDQLEQFRNRIEDEIAGLLEKMKINFPDPMFGRERIPDEGDQASAILERDLEITLKDRERVRLKLLNDAKDRIENGSFGICEGCGSNISKKRLELNPTASLCIKCQEKAERETGKSFRKLFRTIQ